MDETLPERPRLGGLSANARPEKAAAFLWHAIGIFLVTLLAYWPSLRGEFLWDDDGHVTKAELQSWKGLARIWTEPAATQQYYPLLHSAFWVEHRLWGDRPLGYRLANIFFHATAACLLAAALRKLAVPGAWLAAFVFTVHPVGVESVAWISEQKNTLSLVFYLAAALAYLRFNETRRIVHYALATLLFVAALLSKTVTATLPAALLVVAWWRDGSVRWRRDVLPLSLWLVVGLGAGLVTAQAEHHLIGAESGDYGLTALQRVLLAGRVIWFYLAKLLWPTGLIFIYPRWHVDAGTAWQYFFPIGVFAGAGVLAWRRARGALAAFLIFCGTLVPALGFINVYPFRFSFVADHFQYHASLAVIAALAAGATLAGARLPRGVALATAGLLVAGLATLTFRQGKLYLGNEQLFEATVEKNPAAWMAHNNLAILLGSTGRFEAALAHAERAVALEPGAAELWNTLGNQLVHLGRAAEAVPHLQRAVALDPKFAAAHNTLGIAFMSLGRDTDGAGEFQEAMRLDRNFAAARFNYGLVLAQRGRTAEAIEYFQQALRLKPAYGDAELHWGVCLTLQQKYSEAMPHFERAIRLNPGSAETIRLHGVALGQADRFPEAIAELRRAIALEPDFVQAHHDLAQLLGFTGQTAEANAHFQKAAQLEAAARAAAER